MLGQETGSSCKEYQLSTGDQHSQHGELVPHSENCIADSLAHQYNHSIASDAAVDQIDSGQT